MDMIKINNKFITRTTLSCFVTDVHKRSNGIYGRIRDKFFVIRMLVYGEITGVGLLIDIEEDIIYNVKVYMFDNYQNTVISENSYNTFFISKKEFIKGIF